MSSLDTVSHEHQGFNMYFWISAIIIVLAGSGLTYLSIQWYKEIVTTAEEQSDQLQAMQTAFRYRNFFCSSNQYISDPLLRKVTNEFDAIEASFVPRTLVQLPSQYIHPRVGRPQVREDIAPHVIAMLDKAHEAGLDLRVNSAYRSFTQQQKIYTYSTEVLLITKPEVAARPGHSEHQLGAAVDISLYPSNGKAGYDWLAQNAPSFGFALSYPEGAQQATGFQYEPWHWRYVGVDIAEYVQDKEILFNLQQATLLPAPQRERTELPYEYLGRDIWVWKSLENGKNVEAIMKGNEGGDIERDITSLIGYFDKGYVQSDARNLILPVRDWILESESKLYIDKDAIEWIRTNYASVTEGQPTERVEILYREDLGYLIINHQEQKLADRIVKEISGMCGFGQK